ncbi:unnamed protein product [Medioppia subpectinata]|uniref:Sodium-dependent glucose transporter 1 n=1 Tax=Medioppia subpectinata TaxID=1979941 RepID=A0A7R9KKD1_9ACAR|nr:unnamed protein product [Medioppia subpectinata]CAG2103982.1 unnamed protein product [Medioppia subpectinata]
MKYVNRQLVLIGLVLVMATATSMVPNSPHVTVLYACALAVGTCAGAWSNAKTVWLIEIWQTSNAPVLHLCSFLFGIGTIIGPLVDKQFVLGDRLASNSSLVNLASTGTGAADHDAVPLPGKSMLWLPFAIIGGCTLMALMYLCKKYENQNHMISESQSQVSDELVSRKLFDKKRTDTVQPTSDVELGYPTSTVTSTLITITPATPITALDNKPYNPTTAPIIDTPTPAKHHTLLDNFRQNHDRWLLIGLVSAFLAFQMSSEVIYMQFSATYFQYIPLKLSAQTSATLMSSMALTFTMGRGISIFVAMRFRPQHIIAGHLLISFAGLAILYAGQRSLECLWAGSMIMSYGLSPIICSTYCFLAQYLDVKNRVGTVLLFSAESLNMFVPFLMGLSMLFS